jgi:broad specificity phosphatase PhoE
VAVQLVYETHAITTDNEAGIATGWLPGRLSEAGFVAAAELGARRRNDGIVVACVSDLERARETARIAFEGSSMPIIEDARLRECNYGRLNGMPRARLERERLQHVETPWPGGESYLDVVARTAEFLADVARDRDGSRVLLIGHSANQWAIEHLLLGADLAALVAAGMTWRPGWEYVLPARWTVTDKVAQPGSRMRFDE